MLDNLRCAATVSITIIASIIFIVLGSATACSTNATLYPGTGINYPPGVYSLNDCNVTLLPYDPLSHYDNILLAYSPSNDALVRGLSGGFVRLIELFGRRLPCSVDENCYTISSTGAELSTAVTQIATALQWQNFSIISTPDSTLSPIGATERLIPAFSNGVLDTASLRSMLVTGQRTHVVIDGPLVLLQEVIKIRAITAKFQMVWLGCANYSNEVINLCDTSRLQDPVMTAFELISTNASGTALAELGLIYDQGQGSLRGPLEVRWAGTVLGSPDNFTVTPSLIQAVSPVLKIGLLWPRTYAASTAPHIKGFFEQYYYVKLDGIARHNLDQTVPGYQLIAVTADSRNTEAGAASAALSLIDAKVDVVIGDFTSATTQAASLILSQVGIPQISIAATSDSLSSKASYRTFTRLVSPDAYQSQTLVDLVLRYGWRKVACFNVLDTYGTTGMDAFARLAADKGITILTRQAGITGTSNFTDIAEKIKLSKARVIVVFSQGTTTASFMTEMANRGMTDSSYVYIGTDGFTSFVPDASNVTGFNGMLGLAPFLGTDEVNRDLTAMIRSINVANNPHVGPNAALYRSSNRAYDAVTLCAKALRAMVLAGSPRSMLLNHMYNVTFDGYSGFVSLDSQGNRPPFYTVLNYKAKNWANIGTWEEGVIQLSALAVFADGSTNAPPDAVIYPEYYVEYGSAAAITFIVLFILVAFIKGFGSYVVIRYRATPVVRQASPRFLCIMLAGGVILSLSLLFWMGRPTAWLCNLKVWLGFCGFFLMFGPIFAKTWRLYRLFTDESMKITAITDVHLGIYFFVFFAVQVMILILWTSIHPLGVTTVVDDFNSHVDVVCDGTAWRVWFTVSMVYNGLLVVATAILAFRARKLPAAFNESFWIGLSVYNFILVGSVAVGLALYLSNDPVASFILAAVGIIVGCITTFVFNIGYKIYIAVVRPDLNVSSGRKSGSKTLSGTTTKSHSGSMHVSEAPKMIDGTTKK